MAILFRPYFPYDTEIMLDKLKGAFDNQDLRITPDIGDPADIHYIIGWGFMKGDKTNWPNLKAFLSLSAGVNQYIGHPEFPQKGDLIRMIEPGLTDSMTEYIAAYILRFHRELDINERDAINQNDWTAHAPKLAKDRHVGFLGLGTLAEATIKKLKPFGFQFSGWSRSSKTIEGVTSYYGDDQLDEFLSQTEILICLLPLSDETRGILNKDTLEKLPKGAYVINVARGPHIIDQDLITLIDNNHISGAALDVFHKEPLPKDHQFWAHPKIAVTPHVAGVTIPETAIPVLKRTIEEIENGQTPAGYVDPGKGY